MYTDNLVIQRVGNRFHATLPPYFTPGLHTFIVGVGLTRKTAVRNWQQQYNRLVAE